MYITQEITQEDLALAKAMKTKDGREAGNLMPTGRFIYSDLRFDP